MVKSEGAEVEMKKLDIISKDVVSNMGPNVACARLEWDCEDYG